MRYTMKQKMLCFGNDFAINDEAGKLAYFVDGRGFTYGQQLSFQDASRKEVAFISQKLVAFVKTFDIIQDKHVVATVKKKPFTARDRFEVDTPDGMEKLKIVGNFLQYDYKIHRGFEQLARVYKRMFSITDTYEIEVTNPKDTVLVLAAAVVIDLVCHND